MFAEDVSEFDFIYSAIVTRNKYNIKRLAEQYFQRQDSNYSNLQYFNNNNRSPFDINPTIKHL